MAVALVGRKKHMTQVFEEDGTVVGVTVLEVEPNVITAVRTEEADGYEAVQVGFGQVDSRKVNRPQAGIFARLGVPPRRHLRELRGVSGEVGETLTVEAFAPGDRVHVTGTSKGRGFQGTVKRHGFGRGPVTHGSHNVRQPGSIGQSADPSRVFPGRKMPGHMGSETVTVRNLRVVAVDPEKGEILVEGGVPGARNGLVTIRKAGE
ncbi:50S ribosomal protein L3 [Rubrobacter taiwanensis]|jgi:large subunit ribosomal protein L3|uniref:Large ribosomal subunit protein uL3 n=1 Tax=Rubrobacter taiwanensis TaxID=185139 RepID=A0A4R1BLD6_9ACTN|nr:50S ribosomal protein L3 [Rubrobacter taiwanensis]TCJ18240.1 50S ribosomal protein L3 [Rubrobacter taiwanensis]